MKAAPHRHPALRALALILLGCYSFVFFQTQVIHPLAHSGHDHELHSEQAEADLCHQAIYHQAKAACGHHEHIKSTHQDCEFCDILLSTPEIEDDNNSQKLTTAAFTPLASYYLSVAKSTDLLLNSDRGPPALV